MKYSSIFIISVLTVVLYAVFNSSKAENSKSNIDYTTYDMSSLHGQVFTRFNDSTYEIISSYNLNIDEYMPLTVLLKESSLSFKNKPNDKVIGDNGTAIGYMQVRKPALIDVNKNFNLSFSFSDLYNEYNNLLIGMLYLEMCYKSALRNSKNPVWLTFKKYNGGIDETDTSNNAYAVKYADNSILHYNKLKALI